MKVVFNRLILDSFMSYDHETIDLDSQGVVLLKGINNSDSKSESNGSGKSVLVSDSILWCLTGFTTRSTNQVSNMFLDRGASVQLDFMIDNVSYSVTRGTHGSLIGNNLKIIKDGVDISKTLLTENDKLLELELGKINWNTIMSISVLAQGMEYSLSSYKPSDRKSKLEELASLEELHRSIKTLTDSTLAKYTTKDTVLNTEFKMLSDRVSYLNTQLEVVKSDITKYETESLDEESVKLQLLEKSKQVNENISSTESMIESVKLKTQSLSDEVAKARLVVDNINKELSDLKLTKTKIESEMSIINTKLDSNKKEYERLYGEYLEVSNSKCNSCHQLLSPELRDSMSSKISDKIDLIVNQTNEYLSKLTELDTKLSEVDESRVSKLTSDLGVAKITLSNYQSQYDLSNTELSNLNNTYRLLTSELKSINESLSYKKPDVSSLYSKYDEINKELDQLSKDINSKKLEIDNNSDNLKIAKWFNLQSAKSLRAHLLVGVINFLNSRCEEYSEYLFESSRVSLKVEKTNINIYLDERLSQSLSGGERRRVDIIIQLALRDLVQYDTGLSFNLLVVDEALDFVDNSGISNVLSLISSQKDTINTIILITHKGDADLTYDRTWIVEKSSDNISRVIM